MLKRRKFPRIERDWNLKYNLLDRTVIQGSPLSSLAINLSGGGVCFTTRQPIAPDAMLALEIASVDLQMPIIAMARVVWCKKHRLEDAFDLGCEFYWVGWKDDSAQKSLADYIRKRTEVAADQVV